MELGLLLVVAFSLLGRIPMLNGSAVAGSRGSKLSLWGFESRPGIYHLRDLKQNTSVLCSSVSSSIKKKKKMLQIAWSSLWGLNEIWPVKHLPQCLVIFRWWSVYLDHHLNITCDRCHTSGDAPCLGLAYTQDAVRFVCHKQTPKGLSEWGLFLWGAFVKGYPVHHVLPVVSENMQRPCLDHMLDHFLRPLVSLSEVSLAYRKQEWHRNTWPPHGVLGPGHLSRGCIKIQVVSLPLLLDDMARICPGLLKQLDVHQDKLFLTELCIYIFFFAFFAQPRTKISRGFLEPHNWVFYEIRVIPAALGMFVTKFERESLSFPITLFKLLLYTS